MPCCAIATCDDPACWLCTVTAKLQQLAAAAERQAKFAEPKKIEKPAKRFKKRHRVGPHR